MTANVQNRKRKGPADMRRKNKALKILKDKSGASMMMVMGILLMLIAVGVSAVVAAGANAGAGINQRVYNQLNIYAESVMKTIMFSINEASVKDIDKRVDGTGSPPTTLGGQLIQAIYRDPSISSLELELTGVDVPVSKISVEIDVKNFFHMPYRVSELVPEIINWTPGDAGHNCDDYDDCDDCGGYRPYIPPEPITYTYHIPAIRERFEILMADITFEFTVTHNRKTIKYRITYRLSDVLIETRNFTIWFTLDDFVSNGMPITVPKAGTWRVIEYEKIG
jgi:hypothetical protein